MRITIEIDDELLKQVMRRAAEEGTSPQALIDKALRAHVGRSRREGSYRLRWRTESGQLKTRIGVEDRNALFDLMQGS
jgi:Arc/MetJ family transcription regulator